MEGRLSLKRQITHLLLHLEGWWQFVDGRQQLVGGRWQIVVGRWQLVVGRWQLVVGSWQLVGDSWAPVAFMGADGGNYKYGNFLDKDQCQKCENSGKF